jgi:hypothetical protein
MKNAIKTWFKRVIILPWLKKNRIEATQELRDTIVFQMWHGGVGWTNINKWLPTIGMPTIKGYTGEGRKNIRLFYEEPKPGNVPAGYKRIA